MSFISKQQLYGAILFFIGSFVLSICSKWEKKRKEKLKDPKVRIANYGQKKSDLMKSYTLRGALLTFTGLGLAIFGALLFLMNIK